MDAINIQNLSVKLTDNWGKKVQILNNISLDVPKWKIFGFIGPNGAGKTTTINTLLWFIEHIDWDFQILGESLNKEALNKIWYAPDEAMYYDYLTGLEHIVFFGKLGWLSTIDAHKKWEELLNKLWLDFAKNRRISKYSKGMKQRLWIALSLVNDPELLIWDEPMNGLDPLGRKLIKELMIELRKQGKTLFFSTHILSDVQQVADQFAIINNGSILLKSDMKEIATDLEDFFVETIHSQEEYIAIK